jgi:hypothetical protein
MPCLATKGVSSRPLPPLAAAEEKHEAAALYLRQRHQKQGCLSPVHHTKSIHKTSRLRPKGQQ